MLKNNGKQLPAQLVKQKYLIISSVSLNMTPSRCVDILLASNGFKRIGFLQSSFIDPAVGYLNKKIQGGALGLPAQLYAKDQVLVLQLRSNIRIGRKKQFVQQLSTLIQKISVKSLLVIGALPLSLRPDFQIQSVGKNIYSYSKGIQSPQLKKSHQSNLLKSLKSLILPQSSLPSSSSSSSPKDEEQEMLQILGQTGFIKNMIKCQKIKNVDYLCVFSEAIVDHQAAIQLAKMVSIVSGRKELGVVEGNVLD